MSNKTILCNLTLVRQAYMCVCLLYCCILSCLLFWVFFTFVASFYRAMHFSAKRGIAIACRLSVRLSVCNVGEL